ncbi:MAG: sensor histidine kinase [Rikenellaceae bacterium]|jgi:signal transduction histidine kinase|nr:sensor histidine kinase [Rikenellaceae bacterium]
MVLQILLIITIVLQLIAAVNAIRLTRSTKYTITWVLFTVALCAMAFQGFATYYQHVADKELRLPPDFFVWMGIIISLCFAIGIFHVSKLFKYIVKLDSQQRLTQKRILNTVLRTEESERARFSKELHDGLGPLLASAKMSLSTLDRSGAQGETIDNLSSVVDEAIRSIREISNNLSPHTLKDFGLHRAVSNYIGKSRSISGVTIEFDSNIARRRYDSNVEIILFRVASELIANSLRHSGATTVNLALNENNGALTLDYSDNGRGFDPDAVGDTGMGMANIASRIGSLKGTVVIDSAPGHGMRASATVNLIEAVQWK